MNLIPYTEVERQRLDTYSQWAAERIFAAHPSWVNFVVITDNNSLFISMPWLLSPFKELMVSTENSEMTVFAGPWHFHFKEGKENDSFGDGLILLDKIIKDEIGLVIIEGHKRSSYFSLENVEKIMDGIKASYSSAMYKKVKVTVRVAKYFWGKEPEHAEYHK